MNTRTAWAVVEPGGVIVVETVSPHRRAAIVNWLIARRGIMTLAPAKDADIKDMWARHRGESICTTVTVSYDKEH